MKLQIAGFLLAIGLFASCSASEAQGKLLGTWDTTRTGYDQTLVFSASAFDFRYKGANETEQTASGAYKVTRAVYGGGLASIRLN